MSTPPPTPLDRPPSPKPRGPNQTHHDLHMPANTLSANIVALRVLRHVPHMMCPSAERPVLGSLQIHPSARPSVPLTTCLTGA